MGKMMKKAGAAVVAVTIAAGLAACSDKGDDIKDKVNKANQQVQDEEQELFSFRKEDNGAVLTAYNGNDEEVEIPKEYDGLAVVRIEKEAFGEGKEITRITIPDCVTQIDYNAFPDTWTFTVAAYEGTYAEYYAHNWGHTFESLGERNAQASSVTIWNKEGMYCETLSLGQAPKEDWSEGVSFVKEDGKSVLRLDNCDIGMIEQQWTGDLTIELADGSKNYVTGEKGMDGISVGGNLTIRGNGDISISGSDYFSVREGGQYSVGLGVLVIGDLTIEDGVQMFSKGGKSKSMMAYGVLVYGNLTISDSKLEAQAEGSEMATPAIYADVISGDGEAEHSGKIVLDKVKVAEGGFVTPVHFVGHSEESGEQYDIQSGESFSSADSIVYNGDEEMGFEGASSYVRIEPDATANQ